MAKDISKLPLVEAESEKQDNIWIKSYFVLHTSKDSIKTRIKDLKEWDSSNSMEVRGKKLAALEFLLENGYF